VVCAAWSAICCGGWPFCCMRRLVPGSWLRSGRPPTVPTIGGSRPTPAGAALCYKRHQPVVRALRRRRPRRGAFGPRRRWRAFRPASAARPVCHGCFGSGGWAGPGEPVAARRRWSCCWSWLWLTPPGTSDRTRPGRAACFWGGVGLAAVHRRRVQPHGRHLPIRYTVALGPGGPPRCSASAGGSLLGPRSGRGRSGQCRRSWARLGLGGPGGARRAGRGHRRVGPGYCWYRDADLAPLSLRLGVLSLPRRRRSPRWHRA